MLDPAPTLETLPLANLRVIVRVDFDVVVDPKGEVSNVAPLRRLLPTFEHVTSQGGRLVIAGNCSTSNRQDRAAPSIDPVGMALAGLTGWEILVPDSATGDAARKVVGDQRPGQVCLLPNLAHEPNDLAADEAFAHQLARLGDVYVLDSLSLADQTLASVTLLPRLVPHRMLGLALRADLAAIEQLRQPSRPFVAVLGGRHLAEELERFESLLGRANTICLAGGVANTMLVASGHDLGATRVENELLAQARSLWDRADHARVEVLVPEDVRVARRPHSTERHAVTVSAIPEDQIVVDVGPRTTNRYKHVCETAGTVVVSGPMGLQGKGLSTAAERELYPALANSPSFTAVLGPAATQAAWACDEALPTRFDLFAKAVEPVWRLLSGARLPGLQALR